MLRDGAGRRDSARSGLTAEAGHGPSYTDAMTVKQALREWIERMTDEEAAELLAHLEWEAADEDELTPEEWEDARLGRLENERGESVDGEALFRELGV